MKLLDPETGTAQATRTNQAGLYIFPQVEGRTYTFTVAKQGFSTFRILGQELGSGATLTINAALKPGAATTFVDAPAIGAQSGGGSVGSSAQDSKALTAAPTLGNEAASMAVLAAGTTSSGNSGGAFSDQNVFLLDGGSNVDDFSGNTSSTYSVNWAGLGGTQTNGSSAGIVPTSVESVDQVRTSAFGSGADAANAIGGQTQMVTKHGTNAYHGAAYGSYFGSNWGGANTWANNHTPSLRLGLPYTPLPITHRSRFGGALGGVLLPKFAGGKTYFFVNYEGSRFPNSSTYTAQDPSALMRAGVIQVANSAGVYLPYNLNPTPVTVNGTTYQPAMCGSGLCDPRGLGLSPTIKQIWNMMPLPNEFQSAGDQYNIQGFQGPTKAPLVQNSYVARIDHNFSQKERFFASYRMTRIQNATTGQIDFGGVFKGDTAGEIAAIYHRPQHPSLMVVGLTSQPKPTMTNDLRFSYTRNWYQWAGAGQPPQYAGLGGAVEIGGEGSTSNATNSAPNMLSPYNTNESPTRQRVWDGQDKFVKDDLTWLRGKHLLQMGGSYMRINGMFIRDDNPQGLINRVVYQVTNSNTNFQGFQYPSTVPSGQQTNWNTYYAYVLGMVSQSQLNVIRDDKLNVTPIGSFATLRQIIPAYNTYVSDSWRIKPSVTIVAGLGYMVQMPPKAIQGLQIGLVDQNGTQIVASEYLAKREQAALAGQVYQPNIGWADPAHMANNPKYSYDPFYGGLSPRISVAWTPHASNGLLQTLLGDRKTSIRGGYARMYGRMNAVRTFSSPMQGPGTMQSISCTGPSSNGQCLGNNGVTPSTVFRVGPDGNTVPLPAVPTVLPEPYYPGVGTNPAAVDDGALDKHMRPQGTDSVTMTVSRQINRNLSLDVGYVGRRIRHEMLPLNIDALPYMFTLGGQQFANAYANTYWAIPAAGTLPSGFTVPAQPFFESALGGATSAYCQGYANCTTAVAFKNTTAFRNTAVSDLWTAMSSSPSWTIGRNMLSAPLGAGMPSQGYSWVPQSTDGFSNYNALIATFRLRDYHGFTGTSNFTWGRALGTATSEQSASSGTAEDVFHVAHIYGVQSFDIKYMLNFSMTYAPKAFAKQKGVLGHVLGGWTFSPIFTTQSGSPLSVTYSQGGCTGCQEFGEVSTASSGYHSLTTNAQATQPYPVSTRGTYNNFGANGAGTNNPTGINMFSDPSVVLASFRKCVLGYDTGCGGYGMRGLPYWNVDAGLRKSIKVWKESSGAELRINFTNMFNHAQLASPSLVMTTAQQFGRITAVNNIPRQLQFGLRLFF